MPGILEWGLGFVRSVQTIANPALTALMQAITFLGAEYAYLAMIPLIYWCIDEKKGLRLGIAVLFSAWLNLSLKDAWKQPRPYDIDPTVGLAHDKTPFGLPSGHSQNSVVFWGIVGPWFRAPHGILAAILLPLLIGFTRLYLGVHFPTDILAGWILGALVLGVYYAFGALIEALLAGANRQVKLLLLAAIVFIMNGLYPSDVSIGGVFLGMGVGYLLMTEKFPFSASRAADGTSAPIAARAARLVIGLLGAALLYFGLKLLFPGTGTPSYSLFRFIRYGVVGFWVAAVAPWLFLRLKLAGSR
ncbi:MAG: phosphatase PAP2 family protein [Treponemataceae bacterium]